MDKIHNHEVAGSIPAPATIKEISKLRHGSLLIFVCVPLELFHGEVCVPLELFHGEGEVGVREGLVFEGEVPPFAVEGLGCLFRQQGGGLQITVHARAHEIIGAVIADLEDSVWHHIGDVCKLAAVISGRHCGLFLVVGTTVGRHYAADDEDNGNHT